MYPGSLRRLVEGRGRAAAPRPDPATRAGALTASTACSAIAARHRAGEHGPRLRDRIDPALVVVRRSERRAVVVVAAPEPLAVPGRLQAGGEARRLARGSARRGRRRPARRTARANSCSTTWRKNPSHVLSPRPCCADAVHAVVPVAGCRRAAGRARRRCSPWRWRGRSVRTACPSSGPTRGSSYDSWTPSVEQPCRSRNGTRSSRTSRSPVRVHVLRHGVGQPQQVVGAAGPQPAPRRLVPPVLDVALDELPAGAAQQVGAGQVGPRRAQRQHVLELIAEAERAARLEVARSRIHPAAERLIEQPGVHHHVERVVGGAHLHRVERPCPAAAPTPSAPARRRQPCDGAR